MATGKSGGKIDENPAVIMVSFFLMGKVLLNPSTCKMNGLSPFQFKLPSAFVFLCRTPMSVFTLMTEMAKEKCSETLVIIPTTPLLLITPSPF